MQNRRGRRPSSTLRLILPLLLGGHYLGTALPAAILTVNDDEPADFTSVQAAIDAADAVAGYREIRVAAGTYVENVSIVDRLGETAPGQVDLTGGWDPTFTFRSRDATITVLRNALPGRRPFSLECRSRAFRIEGFTFTGGRALVEGGGVRISAVSQCDVDFVGNRISDNVVGHDGGTDLVTRGGGIRAIVAAGGRLRIHDNSITDNAVETTVNGWGGGGDFAGFEETGRLEITANEFLRNRVVAARDQVGVAGAAGLYALSSSARPVLVLDNLIQGNLFRLDPGVTPQSRACTGAAFSIQSDCRGGSTPPECGNAALFVERNRILDNRAEADEEEEVAHTLLQSTGGVLRFSDSIVAGGNGLGLRVRAQDIVPDAPLVQLVNSTVADHVGVGIQTDVAPFGSSRITIANTISALNGGTPIEMLGDPTGVELDAGSNLFGGDPLFEAGSRYDLRSESPAVDAGNDTPAGGLGAWDVYRRDRLAGERVDIGATERQEVDSGSDGGLCSVTDPFPPPDFVPACRCFEDSALRQFRCGFFLRDLLVDLNVPFDGTRSKPFEVSWHVLPWSGVEGAYALEAILLNEQGKETQRVAVKTHPPKLEDGLLAGGRLVGKSAVGLEPGTTLRTRVRYVSVDGKPVELALDAALPKKPSP